MHKFELKCITKDENEAYLRQRSLEVKLGDPEINNNLAVLQDYCRENDVLAMAGIQIGIPKRVVYVKISNLDIIDKRRTKDGIFHTDKAIETMKMLRQSTKQFRQTHGYEILSIFGDFNNLKPRNRKDDLTR